MKIDVQDTYTILADDRGAFVDFVPFIGQQIPNHFADTNIVLDLLKYTHIELEELLLLLPISNKHRASKHSFVIVNDAANPDDIPMELVVVPTLQEAADIIEMEEIERDLGF